MAETGTNIPNVLNLADADLRGFDPIDAGSYDAVVHEAKGTKTTNPDGNLPEGTDGIRVTFKVQGGEFDGRNIWNTYWFPPAEYDAEKRNKMLGMFARFLMAIGYPQKEVTSGKFKFDADDAIGRPCRITVGIKGDFNTIRKVEPIGVTADEAGIL